MKKGFSKIEIICMIVFLCVSLLCITWYILYAYFAVPEIHLKGKNEVTVELNKSYKEYGAIATLDKTDISNSIKIQNNVDTKKVGDYKVIYSVTNTKGRKIQKVTRTVKVVDKKKPTLTLKKGSPYKIQFGTTYLEPGYTAKDNYDGNLNNKVKIKGVVDTNKIGTYKLYYSVNDSSNNTTTKIRVVKVVDEKAPIITLNGKDKVVVRMNEPYLEQGATAFDNHDGDISDKIVTSGKVNTSSFGVYRITYTVRDSFGNESTAERDVQVGTQSDIDENNYIMISIKDQKMWYYKNGNLILTSGVVTGTQNVWDTITGQFRIKSKARGIYLTGADYRSYVNYWMLIDYRTQIGLHDATWRSSFGGTIYTYNGSHGCVNLPYDIAQKLYNSADIGTMVLIY